MISATQLAQRRKQAAAVIEQAFPTTITIGSKVNIAAATWSKSIGATGELAGLLATCDAVFRVRRELLVGEPIAQKKTELIEGAKKFVIDQIKDANGDPCLYFLCTLA